MAYFEYEPLPSDSHSIRLLRLLPNAVEDASVECQLINYSLAPSRRSSHLYEALSYVWGDPSDRRPISINGDQLDVTVNLHAALCRLRDPELERLLWADAVCVDQSNLKERAEQVRFMAAIYQNASRVNVWLGEERDDSSLAMEIIRTVANEFRVSKDAHPSGGIDYGPRSQKAVLALAERPWFQRIWVLQEVAAARFVSIFCGPEEIVAPCFCRGMDLLDLADDPQLKRIAEIFPVLQIMSGASFHSYGLYTSKTPYTLDIKPLPELIDMFHTHSATDPRDKVYALLGMSNEVPPEARLFPDYEVEWHVVFRRLINFILGAQSTAEVHTWNTQNTALIKSKGCTLGLIRKVTMKSLGEQRIFVLMKSWDEASLEWVLPSSNCFIQPGDLIIHLQGARKPMVVRPRNDYFSIIVITATPPWATDSSYYQSGAEILPWSSLSYRKDVFQRDFLLTWDLDHVQDPLESLVLLADPLQMAANIGSEGFDNILAMARIFDDVEWEDGLRSKYVAMSHIVATGQNSNATFMIHLQLLETILTKWRFYSALKDLLKQCLQLRSEQKSPSTKTVTAIMLDVLDLGALLDADLTFRHMVTDGILSWGEDVLTMLVSLFADKFQVGAFAENILKRLEKQVVRSDPGLIHSIIQNAERHVKWANNLLFELFKKAKHDVQLTLRLLTSACPLADFTPADLVIADNKLIDIFFQDYREDITRLLKETNFCRYAVVGAALSNHRLLEYLCGLFQIEEIRPWAKLQELFWRDMPNINLVVTDIQEGLFPDLERDSLGVELLWIAIKRNNFRVIQVLLESGKVDSNAAPEGERDTPLDEAWRLKHYACISVLEEHGARTSYRCI